KGCAQRGSRQGLTPRSAFVAEKPLGPAASGIHAWNQVSVPLGSPEGKVPEPTKWPSSSSGRPTISSDGKGTSVPPLKEAKRAELPRTRIALLDGLPPEIFSVGVVPPCSVPSPTRCGSPALPASAWPQSDQAGGGRRR